MADHGFSERRACRLIGVNRSAWQYEPLRGRDDAVRERMREIANERRRFGYRRLAILLKREGKSMNLKKVYRLYRENGWRCAGVAVASVRSALGHRWRSRRNPTSAGRSTSYRMHWPAAGASRAQRHRRLQSRMPGVYRRHLVVGPACRPRTHRHRRTSRAAVHGGRRQWHRADRSRRPCLVPGHRRRVALHRAGQAAAEWLRRIVQWSSA